MELILIRHGLPHRVDHGDRTPDPGLDEVGLQQAQVLAETLGDEAITAVYASPLRRARETAEPLAKRFGLDIGLEPDLVELTLGETNYVPFGQGETPAGDKEFRTEFARLLAEPEGAAVLDAFRERVSRRLDGIAAQHPGQTVAVACHGGVISAYLTDILGVNDAMTFFFDYTSITRVMVARGGRRGVRSVNEHLHVPRY